MKRFWSKSEQLLSAEHAGYLPGYNQVVEAALHYLEQQGLQSDPNAIHAVLAAEQTHKVASHMVAAADAKQWAPTLVRKSVSQHAEVEPVAEDDPLTALRQAVEAEAESANVHNFPLSALQREYQGPRHEADTQDLAA